MFPVSKKNDVRIMYYYTVNNILWDLKVGVVGR